MPHFNSQLRLRKFAGVNIPAASTEAAKGHSHGVYFKWRGDWFFTVIDRFYIPCGEAIAKCGLEEYAYEHTILKGEAS